MFLLSKLLKKQRSTPEPPDRIEEENGEENNVNGKENEENKDENKDDEDDDETPERAINKRIRFCRESPPPLSISSFSNNNRSKSYDEDLNEENKRKIPSSIKTKSRPRKTSSLPRLDTNTCLTKFNIALSSGFLKLLCSVLNEEEAENYIGFCRVKKLLIVYNISEFTDYLFTYNKLLKARTFSQFFRQLLLRGFREVNVISAENADLAAFTHADPFVMILMTSIVDTKEECCRIC